MQLIRIMGIIGVIGCLVKMELVSFQLLFLSVVRTIANNGKDEGDDVKRAGESVSNSIKCHFGMYKSN